MPTNNNTPQASTSCGSAATGADIDARIQQAVEAAMRAKLEAAQVRAELEAIRAELADIRAKLEVREKKEKGKTSDEGKKIPPMPNFSDDKEVDFLF